MCLTLGCSAIAGTFEALWSATPHFAKICGLAVALCGVAMCLHGCGCSEDDAVKCSTSYGSSSGSDSCKALEDFVACIDTAGCCDYEQEGTKMSEVLDTTIALFNLVCTGDKKVENACR